MRVSKDSSPPENVAEGQEVPFRVTGDMTIREITQPQTFDVIAKLEGSLGKIHHRGVEAQRKN